MLLFPVMPVGYSIFSCDHKVSVISEGLHGLAELMLQNYYPGPNRRSTSPIPLACFTHSIQSQVHVLGLDVPGFQMQNANYAISGLEIFA